MNNKNYYILLVGILLLFLLPLKVNAASFENAEVPTNAEAQKVGEKTINLLSRHSYDISMSISMLKWKQVFEQTHPSGTYQIAELINFLAEQGVELTKVVAFAHIIGFIESSETKPNSKELVTGYLYQYCSKAEYIEAINNRVQMGKYIPVIFGADGADEESAIIFQVPSIYFYYPVSSLKDDENRYITQLGHDYDSIEAEIEALEARTVRHDTNNFKGISGDGDLVCEGETIPASYAWIFSLIMKENADNIRSGIEFPNYKTYPFYWSTINNYFKEYKSVLSAYGVKTLPTSGKCMNFKTNSQIFGMDKIFNGLVAIPTDNIKEYTEASSTLINVDKTLDKVSYFVRNKPIYNYFTEEDNSARYIGSVVDTGINSRFLNIPDSNGGGAVARYLWSADMGTTCAYTDGGNYFPRDVNPSGAYSLSEYSIDTSLKARTKNMNVKKYSQHGSDKAEDAADLEKVTGMLVCFQFYPSIATNYFSKVLGLPNSVESIEYMNNLGQTDYNGWLTKMSQVANRFWSSTGASNFTINGMPSNFAFGRTDGIRYFSVSTGKALIPAMPPAQEDLVISNSLNKTAENTSISNEFAGEFKYDATSRNVIDWFHNATPKVENDIKSNGGLDVGLRTIFNNRVDNTLSQYFKNNKLDFSNDLNSASSQAFGKDSSSITFEHYLYLGRIPEAGEDIITTNDIQVVGFANYNNEDDFDPSYDSASSARSSIYYLARDGKALTNLQNQLYTFQSDYNAKVLNTYLFGNATINNGFRIKANPYKILKADKLSLMNYSKEDYPELGPNSNGYKGIKSVGKWVGAGNRTEIEAGDVLCYKLDYKFPNDNLVASEINKGTKSLLSKGEWYDTAGTVISTDLNFAILPTEQGKDESGRYKYAQANINTNNDWTKTRLIPPCFNNIYFTRAWLTGDYAADVSGSEKIVNGIQAGFSPNGSSFHTFNVDLAKAGSTTGYQRKTIQLNASYRVWCRGHRLSSLPSNLYNYLDYQNGFKGTASSISNQNDGTKINTNVSASGYSAEGNITNHNKTMIELNKDTLNSMKDKTLSISVPKNKANQYTNDWETISVKLVGTPLKDNAVVDILLTNSSGSQEIGNPEIYRDKSENNEENSITNHLIVGQRGYSPNANYYAYIVVRREAPEYAWKEVIKNSNSSNNAQEVLARDGTCSVEIFKNETDTTTTEILSPIGAMRVGRWNTKDISQFINKNDAIAFRVALGTVKYAKITAHYRAGDYLKNNNPNVIDAEDNNTTNNSWTEIFSSDDYPDFEIVWNASIGDVQIDSEQDYYEGTPYMDFSISQLREEWFGSGSPLVHIYLQYNGNSNPDNGTVNNQHSIITPQTVSGISYLGSGRGTYYFGGGLQGPIECRATWATGGYLWGNYEFEGHINLKGCCWNIYDEIYYGNNQISHIWQIKRSALITTTISSTPCDTKDAKSIGCEKVIPLGQRYRWNVFFRWNQQSTEQLSSKGFLSYQHYITMEPKSDSKGKFLGIFPVLHCSCNCTDWSAGPNNNVKRWRTYEGKPLYYEYHDLRIYLWSSASGLRDITNGSGVVYGGETFYFYYVSIYQSDRSDQPKSPFSPNVNFDYANNGNAPGGHCKTCNYLRRYPNPQDVPGPRHVKISVSGTSTLELVKEYFSPAYILSGGLVNKVYKWQPWGTQKVPINTPAYVINLGFSSYAFLGHYFDTWNSVDGTGYSKPGYAWYQEKNCYCGNVGASIVIVPSTILIGGDKTDTGSNYGDNESESGITDGPWVE